MLVLNPGMARFEEWVWEDVASVALERGAARLVEEWTDFGPHAGMVDVVEQRTTVRLTRRVSGSEMETPALGSSGSLVFYGAAGGTDAGRVRVTVKCVVTGVKTEAGVDQGKGVQTLTFVGVSGVTGGAADPVKIEDAEAATVKAG